MQINGDCSDETGSYTGAFADKTTPAILHCMDDSTSVFGNHCDCRNVSTRENEMSKMSDCNSCRIQSGRSGCGPLLVLRWDLVRCAGAQPVAQRRCQTRGIVKPGREPSAVGWKEGKLPAGWIGVAARLQLGGPFGDLGCLRGLPRNVARRRRVQKTLCRPQAISRRRCDG
jgi:hypothetical protein